MTRKEFNQLNLRKRYQLLMDEGVYIGRRESISHHIHLFALVDLYVEMHVNKHGNHLQWIEIQSNRSILYEYVKNLSLDQ